MASREARECRILFFGSINGKFSKVFAKVSQINDSIGPFVAVVCTGRVIGDYTDEWEPLTSGRLCCPVPLYILGPQDEQELVLYQNSNPSAKDGHIAKNLYYVGETGILTLPCGLRIAYTSLLPQPNGVYGISPSVVPIMKKAMSAIEQFNGVDFFISPRWPLGVLNWTLLPEDFPNEYGDVTLARIACILKPRYHICCLDGEDSFYHDRVLYRNYKEDWECPTVTHFVSLASFDNTKNSKAIYCINTSPIAYDTVSNASRSFSSVTNNPYPDYSFNDENDGFYQNSSSKNFENSLFKDKQTVKQRKTNCWFCLSNPSVQNHMIVRVFCHNYITLCKGGLVPHHMFICPVSHFQCLASLDRDTEFELLEIKKKILKIFKKEKRSLVFFDRNYHSQHLQLQIIPMHKQNPEYLRAIFTKYGNKYGMQFMIINDDQPLSKMFSPSTPYLYLEFDDGIRMIHLIRGKIPIHFVREVMASDEVLALGPETIDWKNCELDRSSEVRLVQELAAKINDVQLS